MPGIETNTYQLTWLVAQIEMEASKRPSASCSWVCPVGGEHTGLMRNVVPFHLCNERTNISSMHLEPPVMRDLKSHVSNEQQKENASKRQIEDDDSSHEPFLSKLTGVNNACRSSERGNHASCLTNKTQLYIFHESISVQPFLDVSFLQTFEADRVTSTRNRKRVVDDLAGLHLRVGVPDHLSCLLLLRILPQREKKRYKSVNGDSRSITPRSIDGGSRYAQELEKRCRPHLNAINDSWRIDEAYIKGRTR